MAKGSSLPLPPPPPLPPRSSRLNAPPRQVMENLTGSKDPNTAAMPPIVPTFTIKVGNKFISSANACRKWVWDSFHSSARNDGAQFRHWVRAGVEYPDYPYARFDIHLDAVSYTEEEFRKYLQTDSWTKSETDKLMEIVKTFELRWPVIFDRWCDFYYRHGTNRKIEDLQHRYYHVATVLTQMRVQKEAAAEATALSTGPNADTSEQHIIEAAAARAIATADPQHQPLIATIGTGTTNKPVFDYERERERRAYLEVLWNRTKDEEIEEAELRQELKLVEAQLRKLKKSGSHILAAGSQASSANASRAVSPAPVVDHAALLEKSFASTAPIPTSGTPYLQSGRLNPPASGGPSGINKTTLKRMEGVMEELKVPIKPKIPTKRVCDMFDRVRKDILTLTVLQKMALQKEGQLQTKRLRLAKLGGGTITTGGRIMDEEALLGITPAPAPTPAPPLAGNRAKGKSKPRGSTAGGKSKTAAAKAAAAATTSGKGGETKSNKATTKRKKKAAEPKTAPIGAEVPAPVAVAVSSGKVADTGEDAKHPAKKRARKG